MKLRTLFSIYAAIGAVYTLGLLLLPGRMLGLYGIAPNPAVLLLGRYFGAALAGTTLVAWYARSTADPGIVRGIAWAFLVSEILAVLVSVLGTVSGAMNSVGWAGAGLSAALAAGFAYFFLRPER